MKVGLNTAITFRMGNAPIDQNQSAKQLSNPNKNENTAPQSPQVDNKPKKGMSERIADVWKFLTVTNQMTASFFKGLGYGAATGVGFLGGAWLFRALPKAFTKGGPSLWQVIRHPLEHTGKPGKVIAGIAGLSVLAYQMIIGKMEANQKTAVIDHKLKVGHRD